ncbi:uncharacterized protein PSFLO_02409 [Pseudozyma flocculosa]|uniref:Diphthine--ammonia ligase n=1 Tax=Pseudozyma flocculosa TaxID=84751 RepID=A0A5C3EXI7_9BASI|nr:uncharacterized protein PSFLO_02409 [Pseudozyma flocculosa]
MKVVGLLSGGKDSCYNLCHCVKNGHELVALATLAPPASTDELDSYMYQTVGHDAVHLVAAAMDLPLYRHQISGTAVNQAAEYGSRRPPGEAGADADTDADGADEPSDEPSDETEDLYRLLMQVKRHHPDVEAVSVGAILSNYQRVRVEHVALRASLALLPLTFLWQRSQPELYDEMIQAGMTSILIKVAGIGLEERDLGKTLHQMRHKLWKLHDLYGAHVCGEGGEYETLTLDSPLFKKRIEIQETETVIHSDSGFGSVSYLRIKRAALVDKELTADLEATTIPDDLDALSKRTLQAIGSAETSSAGGSTAQRGQIAADGLGRLAVDQETVVGKLKPSLTRRGRWMSINNVDGIDAAESSLEEEVVTAFRRVKSLLSGQTPPLDLTHLTHINLYLSSQSLFPTINAIYKRHFGSSPPTRACIAVRPTSSARFHLSAVAFDDLSPSSGATPLPERKALHVQGRSYWAPANIGPYSQAVTIGERILIAGQIGLRPKDLSLPDVAEGLSAHQAAGLQCTLAMQHARRIFHATLESRLGRGWMDGGICWLDESVDVEMARRCWAAQFEAQPRESSDGSDDDDDDDDDDEGQGQGCWLAPHAVFSSGASIAPPMIFATLPSGNLPRSAKVDDDDDDDDDDGEADVPTLQRGSIVCGTDQVRCDVARLWSRRGGSSFGIASFFPSPPPAAAASEAETEQGDDTAIGQARADVEQRAFAKALLYVDGTDLQAAFGLLRQLFPAAKTDEINAIPVSRLHAFPVSASAGLDLLVTAAFALVWHGV